MTDGPGEHVTPFGPDPDRIMPDFVQGSLDTESMAFLAESDFEDVPTPYGLQFAIVVTKWVSRVREQGVTPELVTEINEGLAEREHEYPHVLIWDRARAFLASQLLDAGHLHSSVDLICSMHSRHAMADTIMMLAGREENENADLILTSFLRRFEGEENTERLLGIAQAIIDQTIDDDPSSLEIDTFEAWLSDNDPDYDPVQAWATSQRDIYPEVDWDGMAAWVKDDGSWPGVPVRRRQHELKMQFGMQKTLTKELSTELIEGMVTHLNAAQSEYPDARIWDGFKAALGWRLIERGYPTFVLDFGRAIKDAQYQQALVVELIDHGAEEEAFELANVMADPRLMAETLLDADWLDNKGIGRLVKMIRDDAYPAVRRIACLELLRDRMREKGNMERATEYDVEIADLRRQVQQTSEQQA